MVPIAEKKKQKNKRDQRTMSQCPRTGDKQKGKQRGVRGRRVKEDRENRGAAQLSTGEISTMHNQLRGCSACTQICILPNITRTHVHIGNMLSVSALTVS